MQEPKKGQPAGSTGSKTGGSAGTPGRAGRDQDENARIADTSPGDVRTGGQAGEDALGGPGTQRTAAERGSAGLENVFGMQGQAGMQQRGSTGRSERGGTYGEQMRGWETGAEGAQRRVTRGRGEQESEEAGMRQASMVIRESWEEGDPELQRREEDLHARQQNLGERERSLRERDEQLRMREQGLRERQSRVAGRGMGATDYEDYRIKNTR